MTNDDTSTGIHANLAVWGDPIDHSRSPELHGAAYAALGLDWHYGRRQVDAAGFPAALGGLDASWRGLSLTMPLKEVAFAAASSRDRHATLTGAVNTLRLGPDGPRGYNTDVGGLARALRREGIDAPDTARVIGAGATAASALVALAELGVRRVEVTARSPQKAAPLAALGAQLRVAVTTAKLGDPTPAAVDVTVGTLPGGTDLPDATANALAAVGGTLLDVAYAPWPSSLAARWQAHGAPASSGLSMLVEQALLQVRIFVAGDVAEALPQEEAVLAAMRAVVGLGE